MIIGRLILRVLLVPLGAAFAICIAMLVVVVAHWSKVTELAADDPSGLTAMFVITPMLMISAAVMLVPGAVTVLIAEAFAIRSWIYHALCGGLAAFVGVSTIGPLDPEYGFTAEPLTAVAAGIAAGFTYWAIAGFSAGFWKPVFAQPDAIGPPPLPPSLPPSLPPK
jgi:hypothetical protein